MYKPKRCNRCGKVFRPNNGKQKYCYTCSPIVAQLRKNEWQKNERKNKNVRNTSHLKTWRNEVFWHKKFKNCNKK